MVRSTRALEWNVIVVCRGLWRRVWFGLLGLVSFEEPPQEYAKRRCAIDHGFSPKRVVYDVSAWCLSMCH